MPFSRNRSYDLRVAEPVVGASFDDLLLEQQEEIARLGLLVEACSRLLATLDLDALLPQVLELARRTLAADAYGLWRRSPESNEWMLQASHGLSDAYVAVAGQAIRGNENVVSTAGPIVASDIAAAEWLTPPHKRAHAEPGTRAFLALPLERGEEVIGTLVFYYRERREFSAAEVRSVTAVANVAAAAIGTAQIFAEQTQLAEDRRLIALASEELAASLEFETTLSNVARLVVPTFADWCTVD